MYNVKRWDLRKMNGKQRTIKKCPMWEKGKSDNSEKIMKKKRNKEEEGEGLVCN